jgi:hypothetical protein
VAIPNCDAIRFLGSEAMALDQDLFLVLVTNCTVDFLWFSLVAWFLDIPPWARMCRGSVKLHLLLINTLSQAEHVNVIEKEMVLRMECFLFFRSIAAELILRTHGIGELLLLLLLLEWTERNMPRGKLQVSFSWMIFVPGVGSSSYTSSDYGCGCDYGLLFISFCCLLFVIY